MPWTGPGAASKSAQSCRTDLLILLHAAFREEQEAEHDPEQDRADHADDRQSFQKEKGQRGDQRIRCKQQIPPKKTGSIIAERQSSRLARHFSRDEPGSRYI